MGTQVDRIQPGKVLLMESGDATQTGAWNAVSATAVAVIDISGGDTSLSVVSGSANAVKVAAGQTLAFSITSCNVTSGTVILHEDYKG